MRKECNFQQGMYHYTCNPSSQETETGGSHVCSQPGLYSEILSHTYIHTHTHTHIHMQMQLQQCLVMV
jgi:hypothetical protein